MALHTHAVSRILQAPGRIVRQPGRYPVAEWSHCEFRLACEIQSSRTSIRWSLWRAKQFGGLRSMRIFLLSCPCAPDVYSRSHPSRLPAGLHEHIPICHGKESMPTSVVPSWNSSMNLIWLTPTRNGPKVSWPQKLTEHLRSWQCGEHLAAKECLSPITGHTLIVPSQKTWRYRVIHQFVRLSFFKNV